MTAFERFVVRRHQVDWKQRVLSRPGAAAGQQSGPAPAVGLKAAAQEGQLPGFLRQPVQSLRAPQSLEAVALRSAIPFAVSAVLAEQL